MLFGKKIKLLSIYQQRANTNIAQNKYVDFHIMRFNKSYKIPQEPPYLLNLCRTRVLKKTSPFILLTQSKYNSKNIPFFYRRFYLFLYFLFVRGMKHYIKYKRTHFHLQSILKIFLKKKGKRLEGGIRRKEFYKIKFKYLHNVPLRHQNHLTSK